MSNIKKTSVINKYDDVDFCINTLYDFVYSKKSNKCYKIKYIQHKNIQLIDIKKQPNFNYDDILKNTDIKYIGKNFDRYIFKRYSDTFPVMLRIGIYNEKNDNLSDTGRRELVNMKIPFILSELALTNNLKFLLFPIMNFDITFKDLIKINPTVSNILKKDNIPKNAQLYVQILEHYFKLYTLQKYIEENIKSFTIKHWKILILQILYSLHIIVQKYTTFRHNKLDLNSVYVYKKKITPDNKIYNILGKEYIIPNLGFEIKITNFDNSNIKDIVDNTDTDKINENLYYDMHYILYSLIDIIDKLVIGEKITIPEELNKFFNMVIPKQYRPKQIQRTMKRNIIKKEKFTGLNETYHQKNVHEFLTPTLIFTKKNFFKEFIVNTNKMNENTSSISNSPENIQLYNIKENSINYVDSLSITNNSEDPILMGIKNNNLKIKSKGNYNNKGIKNKSNRKKKYKIIRSKRPLNNQTM